MSVAGSRSGTSSAVPSISDLDGYTIRDCNFPPNAAYPSIQDDDFGFDPPLLKGLNNYQTNSPPNDFPMSGWPEFEREEDSKSFADPPLNLDAYEMDKFITSTLPNVNTAVSRFGQMTPPRSDSASSTYSKSEGKLAPKSTAPERRKRTKAPSKEAEPATASSITTGGRKRKSTRKASTASEKGDSPEEQKRKQSLEKNRLAAAKCRINKKEKTEQLRRDSHDKAVQNAYLKDQVMRMKDEIQQMNAILLAHANCEGCNSPEEIQAHLNDLGNDFLNQQLALSGHHFGEYPALNFSEFPVIPDNFFTEPTTNQFLNPPLPEFNQSTDFEVQTPMQTD
ncbi:uncharacterized protein Z518_05320 [Rhinocladiella mackenziei CBS 650.93]|uniref:BZIP domain-containing protein n=1 Tax=Rhinocladiella mackenziei CBS 650.93 TaxID=1442369 RepID=A0A0D2FQI5_9EURO|nr:uncharacterized protein Z518_05320 [Rhinocladiella mackenziei CBS 650.93]KIX04452.1 hypothetical protein Z518_05320 [Rhinocladiella mackenziei CBS 650.93]